MKFMMIIKADADFEAGAPPDPALMKRMDAFIDEGFRSGVLVTTGGLAPSREGKRIAAAGDGELRLIDGPFAETKELIAGFAIIEVPSLDAAITEGRRFMALHQEVLGAAWKGTCEIRQMFGPG